MKKIIFLLLSIFLMSGCSVRQVDHLSIFSVKGKTLDSISKAPIAGVSVYFIDEGLSDTRDKQENYLKIGESSKNGDVAIEFEYFWGRKESLFHRSPETKYSIELVHSDFQTKRIRFAEEKDTSNDKVTTTLGVTYMTPINK